MNLRIILHTTLHAHQTYYEGNEKAQSNNTVFHNDIPEKMRPAALDLTPDEIKITESAPAKRICHYPKLHQQQNTRKDTTGRCCIGASSGGGHQRLVVDNKTCTQDITAYNRVQVLALHELNSSPIDATIQNVNGSFLECDLCRIVQIVSTLKHRRIAIVGDSVQTQLFTGLECELFRRGFNISDWKIDAWKELPPPPNRKAWKYGVKDQQCFNVTVPVWMSNFGSQRPQVEVCNFQHYRPYLNMKQHKQIADTSDIMVIDYGLHFLTDQIDSSGANEMVEYESSLNALLNMFKDAPDCHLMYRETSAQHFDRDGGDFSLQDSFKSQTCVPHWVNSSLLEGLPERRKVLYKAAESQRYSVLDPYGNPMFSSAFQKMDHELTFLPFWNFTAKLSYLHSTDLDCAHFCYTPHLWYTTWRHLRNALDRLE